MVEVDQYSSGTRRNFLNRISTIKREEEKVIHGKLNRYWVKIKRSNDVDYLVTPLVGFIKGNSQLSVEITRFPGAANQANLTIEYGPSKGSTDATLAWNYVTPTGTINLPLNAS